MTTPALGPVEASVKPLEPGDYIAEPCPNCGRQRVVFDADGRHCCDKCCWCLELGGYDYDLLEQSV